ncbi:VanZ family protein [Photobacterium japonica]|uniref:VanZ family protein n=1 Tax=Photobacterium japonica TaxID=2910235 RepID=UPI003D124D91
MIMIFRLMQRYWVAITVLTLLAITLLSLSPMPSLPTVPGTDKTHHFIAYAALMFPAAFVRPRYWIALGGVFWLWSGAIELIQPYVNRYGEWLDMAANGGGIVCGISLAMLARYVVSHFTNTNVSKSM